MENKDKLREEFFSIVRENVAADSEENFQDIFQEAIWQMNDWYNNDSYYPKPEDILADFFFLTPEQCHRFLSVFLEEMKK